MIDFSAVRQTKHWVRVAQRGCGISVLGDTKNLTGRGSEEPAVADSALSMDWMRCLPEAPPTSSILWLLEKETGWNALQAVFPWSTFPMGYCSLTFPHGPLRRDSVYLQLQATEVPGTQGTAMQEKALSSSMFGRFQVFEENLWEHFFSLWLCMLWVQSVIIASSFFLPQKTNNKTNHSNFSSQFQAAAWLLPETRAVQSDRYIFLCVDTAFFSIIKRKVNGKTYSKIQITTVSQIWNGRGALLRNPTWNLMLSLFLRLDISMERDRQGSSCRIFVHFWPCCWVCRTSAKLVPAACMGDHGRIMSWPFGPLLMQGWKYHLDSFYFLFPFESCPCYDELWGIHGKSPCPFCNFLVNHFVLRRFWWQIKHL